MRTLSCPISLLLFAALAETLGAAPPPHYFTTTVAGSTPSIENPIALKQYLSGGLGLNVIYDDKGNLYYTDYIQVWRLNSDGTDTLVAGTISRPAGPDNGVATAALFTFITGLGFDSAGNLYLSDYGQNTSASSLAGTVRRVTPGGGISTVISGILPSTIAVDGPGNVYMADYDSNGYGRISEYPASGGPPRVIAGNFEATIGNMTVSSGTILIEFVGAGLMQVNLQSGVIIPIFSQLAFLSFAPGPNGIIYLTFDYSIQALMPGGALVPVAGSGQAGSTGDGGPATLASFSPITIAVNPVNGDIAMFDIYGNLVRVISAATGKIQTVAGASHSTGDNGPAVLAQLQTTTGLASDPSGNIYFWDSVGESIRKVSPSGIVTKVAGTGIPGYSGDNGKAALAAVSSAGNLVADKLGNLYFFNFNTTSGTGNVTIRKIDTNAMISTIAGGGTGPVVNGANASSVALSFLIGSPILAVDTTGDLYLGYQVADFTGRILKIDLSQTITLIAGGGPLGDIDGTPPLAAKLPTISTLAVDSVGKVYFGEAGGGESGLRTIDSQGLLATVPLSAQANYPEQLTIDASGNLIFAYNLNAAGGEVFVLDPAGDLTKIAGQTATGTAAGGSTGDGGDALIASFGGLGGLTLDPQGNIYVADGQALIRKLAPYNPSTPPPFLTAGGVIGAGGSVPAVVAVSPNGDATLYGANFGANHTLASSDLVNGKVPTALAGVCVSFGGVPAAMLGVYPTQINVQVPSLPPGPVTVQVTLDCGTSSAVASNFAGVAMQSASPEFFAFIDDPVAGNNPIAALNAVTGVLVGAPGLLAGATFGPAKAGDIVEAYGTGWGVTNPPFGVGVIPGVAGTLASPYTVTLAGTAVPTSNILYAGVAPCCAGLYQINFTVPAGTPSGNQPLVITVGVVPSPPHAFITVQ